MAKTIFNMADGILTPCNEARSWHWFRQVTAPCNVARGSGIMTVNSPSGSTLHCDMWLWDGMPDCMFARLQHPAMWYVALGSWHWFARWQYPAMWQVALRWHATEFAQTSAILEFYIWFRFRPYHRCRRCHSAPVCEILSKSDHPKNDVMSIFKMAELSHLWF